MNRSLFPLLVPILGIAISCSTPDTKNQIANPPAIVRTAVDVVVVRPTYFESRLQTTANLLPYEEVELKAPMAGTVLSIAFKEGQTVKKGQALVRLDDRLMKAQIKGLEAQMAASKAELHRLRELKKLDGVSQEEIDQSEANVKNLEASIEQLMINISLANVVAPFDGKVGMRNFSVGSYLTQGQTITQLAQQDKLKVDFSISGQYVSEVASGKEILVVSNGDSLNAIVYAINPVVSTTSRTIQIRAEIAKNTKGFVPGSFAKVVLPLDIDENALVVPTSVIIPELNSQTLYVYKSGLAERRVVTLGTRTEDNIQIVSGLMAGDTVLTTGLLQVKDRSPIAIKSIVNDVNTKP